MAYANACQAMANTRTKKRVGRVMKATAMPMCQSTNVSSAGLSTTARQGRPPPQGMSSELDITDYNVELSDNARYWEQIHRRGVR